MSRNELTTTAAINAVNTIVADQADTIARISRAIVGKSGQSSGIAGATYTYHSVPESIRNFLDEVTYDPNDMTVSYVDDYFTGVMQDKPIGKEVAVEAGTLEITDEHGSYRVVVGNENYTVCDIAPQHGTAINISNGDIVKAYQLCPSDRLRMINTPVAPNVRDLGGWSCDGGTVKYGKLFRGGQPSAEDKPILVDYLGIRHQMNLRGQEEAEEEGVVESPLGIRNHLYSDFAWYDLSKTEIWTEMLTDVFEAVSYNEPMFFHCSAGADRTGTLAYVILGLLGVSRSDMDKDYELTSFYSAFVTQKPSVRRRTSQLPSLVTDINGLYGTTTRDKLITFVKSLGFTASQINAFRTAMIDGNPEVIT